MLNRRSDPTEEWDEPERPSVVNAGPEARRRWRRRHGKTLLPLVALAIALGIRLASDRNPQLAFALVVGLLVSVLVLGVVSICVALDNRWHRRRARSDELVAVSGAIPMDELAGNRRILDMLRGAEGSLERGSSYGWVRGTVGISPKGLRFMPARQASRASLSQFMIPWSEIAEVEILGNALPLRGAAINLGISLRDENHMSIVVRRGEAVRQALAEVLSPGQP